MRTNLMKFFKTEKKDTSGSHEIPSFSKRRTNPLLLLAANGDIYDTSADELVGNMTLSYSGKQRRLFAGCANLVEDRPTVYVMNASGEVLLAKDVPSQSAAPESEDPKREGQKPTIGNLFP